jgi:hypothetical protein
MHDAVVEASTEADMLAAAAAAYERDFPQLSGSKQPRSAEKVKGQGGYFADA